MKNSIRINNDGTIRVNNEIADYDNLLEHLNPLGEYETKDLGKIVLFDYENGFVEYLLDTCFASGESANYTEMSFDEIMEYYEVQ